MQLLDVIVHNIIDTVRKTSFDAYEILACGNTGHSTRSDCERIFLQWPRIRREEQWRTSCVKPRGIDDADGSEFAASQ